MKTKQVLCYGLLDFINEIKTLVPLEGEHILPSNCAVISICPKDYINSGEFHYFDDVKNKNVLNMDFDDGGPEEYWKGEDRYDTLMKQWQESGDYVKFMPAFDFISNYDKKTPVHFLDYGQAYDMVRFIDRVMNDDNIETIYLHCTAGVSRSQGVVRYILDTYDGNGFYIELNENNPCLTPNAHVVMMLKRMSRMYFGWVDVQQKYQHLISETPENIIPKKNVYEISVTNIYSSTRDKKEIGNYDVNSLYEDELWFLMLCYFSYNCDDEQLGFCAKDEQSRDYVCGRNLLEDTNFPWLYDYFSFDVDYIGCSMCRHPLRLYSPYYDSECNIISNIEVTHWLEDGSRSRVTLPKMNQLFKTREEMIDYMTNLYEENKKIKKEEIRC